MHDKSEHRTNNILDKKNITTKEKGQPLVLIRTMKTSFEQVINY